ncbi:23260_t:CDS:2 [Racocetra persica]|uniref:23260_t:CDS:1 n=1 Tax=Racocetra persica TaxID=160502 RepID=A0ACA9LR20_9GLOM|nr:23260_t:CDS:2 [Racocetra persica]
MAYSEGYLYGSRSLERKSDYTVSYKFIKEYLQLDDSLFNHQDNCYYLTNYCHLENRGGHRYLRPSECSKFVLKQGSHLFYNYNWTYSYHGTDPKNIKSILQYGLKKPGSLAGDKVVKLVNGQMYGTGIYTSKIPLYSQLYAPMTSWEGKYFQTILMVRQKPNSIDTQEGEGTYTTSLLGNAEIHKLYKGKISSDEMQYICSDESSCVLHALLIKVHDNQYDEYHHLTDNHFTDKCLDTLMLYINGKYCW